MEDNKRGERYFLFLLFFSFLLLNSFNFAENSLLSRVQKKFETINSFSVEVVGNRNNIKGELFFKSPDSEKIVFSNYSIIVRTDTVWNFNKKLNRLVIQTTEDNFSPFSIIDIINKLPAMCSYKEDVRNNSFTLNPKDESDLNFNSVKVIVNSQSLPIQIFVTDLNGKEFSFVLKNYKLGRKFNSDFFKFKIVKGIKVVDLR